MKTSYFISIRKGEAGDREWPQQNTIILGAGDFCILHYSTDVSFFMI